MLTHLLLTTWSLIGFFGEDAKVLDVPGKKGEKIEFVGLKRWKAEDLLEKYRAKNPGKPVHACAASFKEQFGFGDAAVIMYADNNKLYTVVTVVEPEDAARVRYHPEIPASEAAAVPEWNDALPIAGNPQLLQAVVQTYGLILNEKTEEARKLAKSSFRLSPEKMQPAWDVMRMHNTPKDHELAIWALGHQGDFRCRTLACVVLMNFADQDSTWWYLADAQRDRHSQVNSTAQLCLNSLARHRKRDVDWRPALGSLRAILRGTNLFAYLTTLDVLRETKIARDLSSELLGDADDLLIAYLKCVHMPSREKVSAFLMYLSGLSDRSPAAWQDWLAETQKRSKRGT